MPAGSASPAAACTLDARKEQVVRWLRQSAHFGSLWKVQHKTWLAGGVDLNDPNCTHPHPGVSVQTRYQGITLGYYDTIPLLFGRSYNKVTDRGRNDLVFARIKTDEPRHWTVFGEKMMPARIFVAEFDSSDPCPGINPWAGKQQLDTRETKALGCWCHQYLPPAA